MRLFSTEQVSKYHPDKYADQISDAILDACLEKDPHSRVACECLVKGTTVVLAGEITTTAELDYGDIVHRVANKLGYRVDEIIIRITKQSPQIAHGIREGADLGAGDQGIMFGYATNETESRLPFGFDLANKIIEEIEARVGEVFKGDAKTQVTVDLDAPATMECVKEILVSACHSPEYSVETVRPLIALLIRNLGVPEGVKLTINPAGEWTVGGPVTDCGLTGRKIVCDQYGGYCPVGGGAFSGKDPSKVDRSGAYMARKIACDLVEVFGMPEVSVQLAYAIGQAEPMSVQVKTEEHNEDVDTVLAEWVKYQYDLTPAGIIKALDLLTPKYEKLAEGCHFKGMMTK